MRQLDEEQAVEEVPQVGAVDTVRQHLSMGLVGMNVTDQMEVDKACEDMLMAGKSTILSCTARVLLVGLMYGSCFIVHCYKPFQLTQMGWGGHLICLYGQFS